MALKSPNWVSFCKKNFQIQLYQLNNIFFIIFLYLGALFRSFVAVCRRTLDWSSLQKLSTPKNFPQEVRDVTKCHKMSQNVTKCHKNVTKCHNALHIWISLTWQVSFLVLNPFLIFYELELLILDSRRRCITRLNPFTLACWFAFGPLFHRFLLRSPFKQKCIR